MRKIVICAYNLSKGGGVQVATSLITLYLTTPLLRKKISCCFVSIEVYNNLADFLKKDSLTKIVPQYATLPIFRFVTDTYFATKYRKDILFFIFGPIYSLEFGILSNLASGIADPWVIESNKFALTKLYPLQLFKLSLTIAVKSFFYSRSKILWVESIFGQEKLKQMAIFKKSKIFYIPNLPNELFFNSSNLIHNNNINTSFFNIALIGYPHLHKNIESMVYVANELKLLAINCVFHTTLPEGKTYTRQFTERVRLQGLESFFMNHGTVTLEICKSIYANCKLSIHPSYMEVSSVSPMEAALQGCDLLLIDLPFNERYKEYCYYFKPFDSSKSIAEIIFRIKQARLDNPSDIKSANLKSLLVGQLADFSKLHSNLLVKIEQL